MIEETRKPRSRKWLYVFLAALVVLGAAFVAGTWFAGRGERSVQKVIDSYEAAYAGVDTPKDVPILLPLYADAAVLRDEAADRTHQGSSEIEDALNTILATPDFDLTIERTLTGGSFATVFWTADGMRPEVGRVAQVRGITTLEISDGRIERETWHYDPAKAPF